MVGAMIMMMMGEIYDVIMKIMIKENMILE